MANIQINDLRKVYDGQEVVKGIDLEILHSEFIALVGPSGCGKSTTLRMIAGLEDITSGEISIGDRLVNNVPPKDRDVAMVFQNYALYPHMNVYQNLSIALSLRKLPKEEIRKRVEEAAQILGIKDLLSRRPKQLSGGQRQRVAMGRAIVRNPSVFLFDEPLSNLDAKLRVQMRSEIKKIHQRVKTTIVYVTHDQVEAMSLADRIVVMNSGKIEQVASPQEMYDNPISRFVAEFIGSPSMNIVPCKLSKKKQDIVLFLENKLTLPIPQDRRNKYINYLDKEMLLGLRPEHITEKRVHTHHNDFDFSAEIKVTEPLGIDTMVYFNIGRNEICARATPSSVTSVGTRMEFTAHLDFMHLIDPETNFVVQ